MRLTEAERRSLLLYCRDHPVATHCGDEFKIIQLAADPRAGEEALCPRCRSRLVEQVRAHVAACHAAPRNLRIEAERQRLLAQILQKQSQQAIDRADLLSAEAEAILDETRRRKGSEGAAK